MGARPWKHVYGSTSMGARLCEHVCGSTPTGAYLWDHASGRTFMWAHLREYAYGSTSMGIRLWGYNSWFHVWSSRSKGCNDESCMSIEMAIFINLVRANSKSFRKFRILGFRMSHFSLRLYDLQFHRKNPRPSTYIYMWFDSLSKGAMFLNADLVFSCHFPYGGLLLGQDWYYSNFRILWSIFKAALWGMKYPWQADTYMHMCVYVYESLGLRVKVVQIYVFMAPAQGWHTHTHTHTHRKV